MSSGLNNMSQLTSIHHTIWCLYYSVPQISRIFCEPLVIRGQVLVVFHFLLLLTSHAAFISVINICVCTLCKFSLNSESFDAALHHFKKVHTRNCSFKKKIFFVSNSTSNVENIISIYNVFSSIICYHWQSLSRGYFYYC